MPKHAFDSVLKKKGWQRLDFSQLPINERDKKAGRLIVLLPSPVHGFRKLLGSIDISAWRQGESVRFELVGPSKVPAMFETLEAQGQAGVHPIALGLTPCRCPRGPRWNPMAVTLAWEQGMNNMSAFTEVMQQFSDLVKTDKQWQCTDMRHLV